jgi:Domain of unknown function (DUF4328)
MEAQDHYRPPATEEPPLGYVDQGSRVRTLLRLLYALTAMELGTIVLQFAHVPQVLGLTFNAVGILVFLLSAGVFLTFLARASSNAGVLRGRPLATSPAMLIGWFFVPMANLWKPREAVEEIWRALPEGSTEPSSEGPVVRWWGVWLVAIFLCGVPILGSAAIFAIFQLFEVPSAMELAIFLSSNLSMALASWETTRFVRALHLRQARASSAAMDS